MKKRMNTLAALKMHTDPGQPGNDQTAEDAAGGDGADAPAPEAEAVTEEA